MLGVRVPSGVPERKAPKVLGYKAFGAFFLFFQPFIFSSFQYKK
uniref:Uncharacterized protein n=1 Tax=Siphoviridae sp. ct5co22 TaxID=2826294 RepID=A0A8S5QUT6_9CAUD|nr:MAG TPA: hypothetical protein [Siphoviridae sp. ct5co22]